MDLEQIADKVNKILLEKFGDTLKIKRVKTSSPLVLFYIFLDKIKYYKYLIMAGEKIELNTSDNHLFYKLIECRNLEQVFKTLGGYTNENIEYIKNELLINKIIKNEYNN